MSEEALDDIIINSSNEEFDDNHGFKEEVEYAGFWIRVGASLIDMLVMIPIYVLLYFNQLNLKSMAILFISTIIMAVYKPLLEWKYGATLGKMACKIKVVNLEVKAINIDQAFGRYIPWAISVVFQLLISTSIFMSPGFENIDTWAEWDKLVQESSLQLVSITYSFLFMIMVICLAFNQRKRGLHDIIAKTLCIKVSK